MKLIEIAESVEKACAEINRKSEIKGRKVEILINECRKHNLEPKYIKKVLGWKNTPRGTNRVI